MRYSPIQLFFAENWPVRIWVGVWVICGVSASLVGIVFTKNFAVSLEFVLLFPVVILCSGLLGYFVSIFVGVIVLPPIFRLRERLNGAPFKEGDFVEVLRRPHRGMKARVYDVWRDRHEIRIDIGPKAREALTDIFPLTAVRRVKGLEQGTGGNAF